MDGAMGPRLGQLGSRREEKWAQQQLHAGHRPTWIAEGARQAALRGLLGGPLGRPKLHQRRPARHACCLLLGRPPMVLALLHPSFQLAWCALHTGAAVRLSTIATCSRTEKDEPVTRTKCACAACQPRHASPLQRSSHRFVFPFAVTAYCGSLSSPPFRHSRALPTTRPTRPGVAVRRCPNGPRRGRAQGDSWLETDDALPGRKGGWGWPRNARAPPLLPGFHGAPSTIGVGPRTSLSLTTRREKGEGWGRGTWRNSRAHATTPPLAPPLPPPSCRGRQKSAASVVKAVDEDSSPTSFTTMSGLCRLPTTRLSDRSLWRRIPRKHRLDAFQHPVPLPRKRPRATQDP